MLPVAGTTVRLTSTNGPPNSAGLLLIGFWQDVAGTPFAGIRLHGNPDPSQAVYYPVTSNVLGYAEVPITIPAGATGQTLFAQFRWGNAAVCGGPGTLSASNALAATIQ